MRRLRMGMIGGGEGAFIGAVHRAAARLDGQIELVCGTFSRSLENSKKTGKKLYLDPNRIYATMEEMFQKENKLSADKRMDFVSIVTPNFLHYSQAKAALKYGFHVVCDKPMTLTLEEAEDLQKIAKEKELHFCLTHTYTGYPLVKQAKHLIQSGELGKVKKVVVEYQQGWLSTALEKEGQKQAEWRMNPEKAGSSCCMGDIGSHAENLLEYITGLEISEVCANLTAHLPERLLDDDGSVWLKLSNGANGLLFASQIATEEENELKIRIYTEKGSLEWLQSKPNELLVGRNGQPKEIQTAGIDKTYLCEKALNACRLPSGHPEGYLEAFANLYTAFVKTVRDKEPIDFPSIYQGIRGMKFIENVVKSSSEGNTWIKNN